MSYTLPQVQVFQIFKQLPQNVVKNLNAFVFGPHFQLFRYAVGAEKDTIKLSKEIDDVVVNGYINDADTEYVWPGQPAGSVVDASYVKLYGDNVLAQYITLDGNMLDSNGDPMARNKIRIGDTVLKTANQVLRSATLNSRDVKVGDRVRWTSGDYGTGWTKVVALEADVVAATVTATAADGNTGGGPYGVVTLATNAVFTGRTTTTYTVQVTKVGALDGTNAQVRISDSAGIDTGRYLYPTSGVAFDLGNYGAELTITASSDMVVGDRYYVECTIPYNTAVHTLVLADDVAVDVADDETLLVDLYMVQTGVNIPSERAWSVGDYNWTADADVLTVMQDMAITDPSWYDGDGLIQMAVYSADLYVEYRALMSTYADTIHSLSDLSDVATTLGDISVDNPLALGVYKALTNSGNRAVYYMATPCTDLADAEAVLAGYLTVLDRASLTKDVYAFAPLTQDRTIYDAVTGHIATMSTEENKAWRIGFYGPAMLTENVVYSLASNPVSDEFYAKYNTSTKVLQFCDIDGTPSTYTEALADVRAGDQIKINFATDAWGNSDYESYEVYEVLTNTSVSLVTGPALAITVQTKVEVVHPYTVAEMADAMAAQSYGFYNRRIYSVFPSTLRSGGVSMGGQFGAAAVAGLCSSVPPQQGLTNIQLLGFDDLPMTYSQFSRAQLNKMAEYGTLIIMQDMIGGEIYIRHQVSTQAMEGNLNTTELSITKNLDSISFFFAGLLAPYIGRYNVTDGLLGALKTTIKDGINYLGSLTDVGLLGPQLILTETEIVNLQQHPVLKDHVLCTINAGMPAPFNVMELRLVV